MNVSSDIEILGRVKLLFCHVHAWVTCLDRFFWKFLFFEQKWERIFAWVLDSDFFDLNGIISQEIIDCEKVNSTFEGIVVPEYSEREDPSIIIEILFKAVVRMASSEFNFNVLFVLLGVRRVDFGIFSSNELVEKVSGFRIWWVEWGFHITVKIFGKAVTVVNVENSFVEVDVDSDVKVSPSVIVGKFTDDFRDFLPFKEDALWNAWVFDLWLSDVNGFVSKVIINNDFSDAVVFESAFNDVFLEVTIKSEDFSVILQPWWLDSGNVIIFWGFSVLKEGKLSDAFGEFINEVFIDFLLDVLSFLLHASVNKIELLSFVVVLFIRVTEDMTWEEWNLFGKVLLHQYFILFISYILSILFSYSFWLLYYLSSLENKKNRKNRKINLFLNEVNKKYVLNVGHYVSVFIKILKRLAL